MDEDDEEESEEEADDTFMRDGRRVTLDQMGNEVSASDEEVTGMVEEEGEPGEEEVEEDELMQDQGMLSGNLVCLKLLTFWCLQRDPHHRSQVTYAKFHR